MLLLTGLLTAYFYHRLQSNRPIICSCSVCYCLVHSNQLDIKDKSPIIGPFTCRLLSDESTIIDERIWARSDKVLWSLTLDYNSSVYTLDIDLRLNFIKEKQGRSQTFQNEGAARGADRDSKWRLSIDPCTKFHFIWGAQGGLDFWLGGSSPPPLRPEGKYCMHLKNWSSSDLHQIKGKCCVHMRNWSSSDLHQALVCTGL